MVEIKKTDLKKLVEQKGQIERRIKSRKLANYKVEQVGGYSCHSLSAQTIM